MKISILLPSYQRANLLELGLRSLANQIRDFDYEIIVINDGIKDDTQQIVNYYKSKLNIKYIFSGYRNLKQESKFRSPSIALNIGIKKAKGDVVIISSPEVFHINQYNLHNLISPLTNNKKILSTPKNIMFDNSGSAVKHFMKSKSTSLPELIWHDLEQNTSRCAYASKLPFCLALYKEELIKIGGYDEDFSGWASEDDDIVERLIANGLKYYYADAYIIHLFHEKQYNRTGRITDQDYLHNANLYKERKGQIVRNKDKEWGRNKRS